MTLGQAFHSDATDEAGVFQDLASHVMHDYATSNLIPATTGVNQPEQPVHDADSFVGAVSGWFTQQRAAQGGPATDAYDTPVQQTYAQRRYEALTAEEGVRSLSYDDKTGAPVPPGQTPKGYVTVGAGFNMDAPDAPKLFAAALPGVDFNAVRNGGQPLNDAQIRQLTDTAAKPVEARISKAFDGVDLAEHQRIALMSLGYQRPAAIQEVADAYKTGGIAGAASAILSQPGNPGRRVRELAMFVGNHDAPSQLSPFVGGGADATSTRIQQHIAGGTGGAAFGLDPTAPAHINDMTGAVPGTGPMAEVKGMIVHHTGSRGDVNAVVNVFRQRGVASNFVIDRQGQTFQILPDGTAGAHIMTGSGVGTGLNNHNVEGVEIIAKDDSDVTPIQQQAALALINARSQKWGYDPTTSVFGHGEVNPGHKQATEGMSVTRLVRNGALAQTADATNPHETGGPGVIPSFAGRRPDTRGDANYSRPPVPMAPAGTGTFTGSVQ